MYLYEMHCHSAESSGCAKTPGAKMAEAYKRLGYTGLFITDHFLNRNTPVPSYKRWPERMDIFCRGYELAKQRGDELGLDVFFGWEFSYLSGDYLTYCLGENWLYDHPYCDRYLIRDYCDLVHADGGFVIHAHPMRESKHTEMLQLVPHHVDGYEVINAGMTSAFENLQAKRLAEMYDLPGSCGTDNHTGIREYMCAVELDHKAESDREILTELLAGRAKLRYFKVTETESGFRFEEADPYENAVDPYLNGFHW